MGFHVPRPTRRIALVYDASRAYDIKVMAGVASYFQENRHGHYYSVDIIDEKAVNENHLSDGRSWQGDGIIADFDDPAIAHRVSQSQVPAVAFGCGRRVGIRGSRVPYFCTNGEAIARLAADHLFDRGFRSLAYCGYARTRTTNWSLEREAAFVQYVKQRGGSCAVFRDRARASREWPATQRHLGEWLRALPKPVGLMAAHDDLGRQVLDACRAYDLRVPHDIAVIGVDNNELLCLLSSPPLSSMEQGARGLGYAAASVLDDIIDGRQAPARHYTVEPVAVVTRRSTDVVAIADTNVARAMAFIQEHACDRIKVPQIVTAAGISRSGLEKRFSAVLGYTIRTAVRRTQLERTRRLILETDMPLKQVASATGFRSVQHMTTLYVHTFGLTPGRHRQLSPPETRLGVRVDGRRLSGDTSVILSAAGTVRWPPPGRRSSSLADP
jgi:LacI family transcriptional regulator